MDFIQLREKFASIMVHLKATQDSHEFLKPTLIVYANIINIRYPDNTFSETQRKRIVEINKLKHYCIRRRKYSKLNKLNREEHFLTSDYRITYKKNNIFKLWPCK